MLGLNFNLLNRRATVLISYCIRCSNYYSNHHWLLCLVFHRHRNNLNLADQNSHHDKLRNLDTGLVADHYRNLGQNPSCTNTDHRDRNAQSRSIYSFFRSSCIDLAFVHKHHTQYYNSNLGKC